MSPHLEETRAWRRFALLFGALTLVLVGALLAWTSHVRYREFEEHQQRIMRSSADGAAGEIAIFISELQRAMHLFADKERVTLQWLARHPEDYRRYDSLQKSVKSYFPNAFASTLADRHGQPFVTDFEGRVEDTCVKDMQKFVADRAHSGVYVHPNNQMYHFDMMVDWEHDRKPAGVFFVSFSTEIIARILKHSELPGHKLMLLRKDVPGLIEIASTGARDTLNRDLKLSPEETRRIGYAVPVSGTLWDLVDLPDAGLFADMRYGLWREAATIMVAVLAAAAVMTALLFRYHARNKRLEYLYTHDAATGFPNRYYFLDRLQRYLHPGRQQNSYCALLLIDLGGFRVASNALLHQRNNQILIKEVGDRIRRELSESDVFAHLAGNEFALLLCGTATDSAMRIAQTIVDSLKRPFTEDKSVTLPKAGIGIAIAPEHGDNAETLTQHATAALSAARLSTSGVALYSPA